MTLKDCFTNKVDPLKNVAVGESAARKKRLMIIIAAASCVYRNKGINFSSDVEIRKFFSELL